MSAPKPILFSAPMVRAILAGQKTQTRRIIKAKYGNIFDGHWTDDFVLDPGNEEWRQASIKFSVGDRLWVREAFSYDRLDIDKDGTLPPWYWADGNPEHGDWTKPKPSIHMPRWASRITLEVTGVNVERLQGISEDDAKAEGVEPCTAGQGEDGPIKTYRTGFVRIWGEINGAESWLANPWVVAVSFKRIPTPTERET